MTEEQRTCEHAVKSGSLAEADGGFDAQEGSVVVDGLCRKCGLSGSALILRSEWNWSDDEVIFGSPTTAVPAPPAEPAKSGRPVVNLYWVRTPGPERYHAYINSEKIGEMILKCGLFEVLYKGKRVDMRYPQGKNIFCNEEERKYFLQEGCDRLVTAYLTASVPKPVEGEVSYQIID